MVQGKSLAEQFRFSLESGSIFRIEREIRSRRELCNTGLKAAHLFGAEDVIKRHQEPLTCSRFELRRDLREEWRIPTAWF